MYRYKHFTLVLFNRFSEKYLEAVNQRTKGNTIAKGRRERRQTKVDKALKTKDRTHKTHD